MRKGLKSGDVIICKVNQHAQGNVLYLAASDSKVLPGKVDEIDRATRDMYTAARTTLMMVADCRAGLGLEEMPEVRWRQRSR
jgi:hypothetical protein